MCGIEFVTIQDLYGIELVTIQHLYGIEIMGRYKPCLVLN